MWGYDAAAADLTSGMFRGGDRPLDIYRRVYVGINGAPMPSRAVEFETNPDAIWHIVHFLKDTAETRRRETVQRRRENLRLDGASSESSENTADEVASQAEEEPAIVEEESDRQVSADEVEDSTGGAAADLSEPEVDAEAELSDGDGVEGDAEVAESEPTDIVQPEEIEETIESDDGFKYDERIGHGRRAGRGRGDGPRPQRPLTRRMKRTDGGVLAIATRRCSTASGSKLLS